jgi:hypothetical protein
MIRSSLPSTKESLLMLTGMTVLVVLAAIVTPLGMPAFQ